MPRDAAKDITGQRHNLWEAVRPVPDSFNLFWEFRCISCRKEVRILHLFRDKRPRTIERCACSPTKVITNLPDTDLDLNPDCDGE